MKKALLIILITITLLLVAAIQITQEKYQQKEYLKNQTTLVKITKPSWYIPSPKTTWHWQLQGKINTSLQVKLYDIDLETTPQETINTLHSKNKKVICYFSAGTYEPYRQDASQFPKEILGNPLEEWQDERWLDISNYQKFSHIMQSRLNLAKQKGCDAIEPDNIDAYTNNNGFNLTYQDQLEYNKWLATNAHKRNLSIALKNNLDQIPDLINIFDFAINEQCFQYEECEKLLPFIKQKKAVLGAEYELEPNKFCKEANNLNLSWIKANYDLNEKTTHC